MFQRSSTLIPRAAPASACPRSLLTTRYLQSAVQPPTANPDVLRDELKARSGRPPVGARLIQTLHPGRLRSSDFVDVSNRKGARILVDHDIAFVRYGACGSSGVIGRVPFPPNARGFLYYHHDPELPPTTGEIRFRVTPDNDVAGFERGKDLVGLNGSPWVMGIVTLTKPSYEPFRRRLVEDGLFDPALMRKLVERWKGRHHLHDPHDRVLHYLEQPFTARLPQGLFIRIVTPDGIGYARQGEMFEDGRAHVQAAPYSGRVLLRLERSRLPEHTGTRSVVIRVLKILEPIEVVIPGYDMRLPVPKEGDLIHKHDHRQVLRPFSIDLDKTRNLELRDIGLLYPKVRAGYLLETAGV